MIAVYVGLIVGIAMAQDNGPSVSIGDLPDYRAALEDLSEAPGESIPFRELWERSEVYKGRRIRVEGTVARRFRQASVGMFPPLTELWVVSASKDPFCLVFPTPDDLDDGTAPGSAIRFDGLFLKPIRYPAADEPRVAPLVVGARPPVPHAVDPLAGQPSRLPMGALDWILGVVLAGLVALLLLRQARSRPVRDSRPRPAPPPSFVDSIDDGDRREGEDDQPSA